MADTLTEATARQKSRGWLRGALQSTWYAFNMEGNPEVPFTYDEKTVERAKALMRELMALQASGEIRLTPGASIQGDRDFQGFMQRVQHG